MFGRNNPLLKGPFNCSMVELLTLCADCSLVAPKPAHSSRFWPPRVFLTKSYDVPYTCKMCARATPFITFEPSARSPLSGRFAGMRFQSTSVNAG